MRKLVLILSMLFIVGIVQAEDDAEAEPVAYLPLEPNIMVNLQGRRTYLRAAVQIMVDNAEHAEKIKIHLPAVRHALIMMVSEYSSDQLSSMEQREEFRKKALEEAKTILDKYASSKGLNDLFFTEFLVQ